MWYYIFKDFTAFYFLCCVLTGKITPCGFGTKLGWFSNGRFILFLLTNFGFPLSLIMLFDTLQNLTPATENLLVWSAAGLACFPGTQSFISLWCTSKECQVHLWAPILNYPVLLTTIILIMSDMNCYKVTIVLLGADCATRTDGATTSGH